MRKPIVGLILFLSFFVWESIHPSACAQWTGYRPGAMQNRKDLEAFLKPPAQEGVEPGYWKVQEGIRLFHFEDGKGEDVIFVHGGPGFPPFAALKGLHLLGKDYRFHYYHQRGCGKSTRPFDKFESPNYMDNMQALVKTLGIEQHVADLDRIRRVLKKEKITLVGHSFGGFISALYAVEFPERVKKLVLVSPAEMLKMPNPGGGMFERIKALLPEGKIREEYQAYQARFFQIFGTAFTKSEKDLVAHNREFIRFYQAALKAQGLSTEEAKAPEGHDGGWMPFGIYFSLGMQYDHTRSLSRITCPVLILHGEKDLVMGMKGIQVYKDNIKSAAVKILKNTGHNSANEKPEEFAVALRAFFEGTAGEAPDVKTKKSDP